MKPECYEVRTIGASGREASEFYALNDTARLNGMAAILCGAVSVRIEPHDVWPSGVAKPVQEATEVPQTVTLTGNEFVGYADLY